MHVVFNFNQRTSLCFFRFKVSVFALFSLLFLRGLNVFGLIFSKTKHRLPTAGEKIFFKIILHKEGNSE